MTKAKAKKKTKSSPAPKKGFALRRIGRFLASLQLAVFIILVLTIALIIATLLESKYDVQTARYYVYQSTAFAILLGVLGVNIFAVAVSRWPWKKRHAAFLTAHLGILILLWGSLLTFLGGIDGSLLVSEGQQNARIELNDQILSISEDSGKKTYVKIPWQPSTATFKEIDVPNLPIRVANFITHAEAKIQFAKSEPFSPEVRTPAAHLRIEGGMLPFPRRVWLWSPDPGWRRLRLGPATFFLYGPEVNVMDFQKDKPKSTTFALFYRLDGSIVWQSYSKIRDEVRSGRIEAGAVKGTTIDTTWMKAAGKGTLKVHFLDMISNAENKSLYVPSRMEYGEQAPPSAIEVELGDPSSGETGKVWIGLGDHLILEVLNRKYRLDFQRDARFMDFQVKLERFQVDYYEGSTRPKSFSSRVSVVENDGRKLEPIVISMNEPLSRGPFTLYQSSYLPGEPRPTTSIFTVNYDPGRWLKYLGSLLIVLGVFLLFWERNKRVKLRPVAI